MKIDEKFRDRKPLCSVYSNAHMEDPGGSAPNWKKCMVIEVSKPWNEEITESRYFPSNVSEALDRAARSGSMPKLQCVAPDTEYSLDGYTRLIYYSRPDSPFVIYSKDEYQVPDSKIGELVSALLENPDRLPRFETYRQRTGNTRDILVCTHGRHDVCCATLGVPIYTELRDRYANESNGKLRVWQASHFGGHRFAPNLLDMPEGRNWIRLGVDHLNTLINHDRPVTELRKCYRGWVGLDNPYKQVLEREVFMRIGWAWTGLLVSAQITKVEDELQRTQVRIDFTDQRGNTSGSYEAVVEQSHVAKRVDCLSGENVDDVPQYSVSRLVRVR